jgi:hypothetical protein
MIVLDPAIVVPIPLLISKKEPHACKEVRDEAELDYKIKHFIDFIQLLLFYTTRKHFDDKLVEVFLVCRELEQFEISQEDVLWIVDGVWYYCNNVQQK